MLQYNMIVHVIAYRRNPSGQALEITSAAQSSNCLNPRGGEVDAGTMRQPGYRNRSGLSLAHPAGLATGTAPSAVTRAA